VHVHVPWFFARYTGSDIICGVHPHHAEFYEKAFGFVQYGPARAYPKVKDHPVTLLRLDIEGSLVAERLPRATKIYIENPLPESAFEHHFNLADPRWPNRKSRLSSGAWLSGRGRAPEIVVSFGNAGGRRPRSRFHSGRYDARNLTKIRRPTAARPAVHRVAFRTSMMRR